MNWVRSSFCSTNSCIDVADLPDGKVVIRSQYAEIWATAEEWAAFVKGVKAGEFDQLAEGGKPVTDIVRIELVSGMGWDIEENTLKACETTRKPHARIVGTSRPDVLRQLADWIEAKADPALGDLSQAFADRKSAGPDTPGGDR